jgi:hypothetical protein
MAYVSIFAVGIKHAARASKSATPAQFALTTGGTCRLAFRIEGDVSLGQYWEEVALRRREPVGFLVFAWRLVLEVPRERTVGIEYRLVAHPPITMIFDCWKGARIGDIPAMSCPACGASGSWL